MRPILTQCISLFFCFLFVQNTQNINAQQDLPTMYEQFCELNKYWEQHPEYASQLTQPAIFESDRALIQQHLKFVERHLQQTDVKHLNATQKANRQKGLEILNAYWKAGVFPINTRHTYTVPYFIDDFNTACAVGHIMRESGEEFANFISQNNNYAYLEEMQYPEIGKWADQMGFSIDELKWIQPAYDPYVEIDVAKVQPSNCDLFDGQIDVEIVNSSFNIGGYQWYIGADTLTGTPYGTNQDLIYADANFYTLVIDPDTIITGQWYTAPILKRISLSDANGPTIAPVVQNQQCFNGAPDGSIDLNLGGDINNYAINWYDYDNNIIAQNVTSISGLEGLDLYVINGIQIPYNYRVEIIDLNDCRTFQEFFVEVESAGPYLSSWQTEIIPATCANDGAIDLGQVYSDTPVSYMWNDGVTTEDRTNLAAGSYSVTIVDDLGCSIVETFEVQNACISTCTDLTSVDFGDCDFPLGIGYQNGQCITISGCDWTVNDIDYTEAFFTDMQVCMSACATNNCIDESMIDLTTVCQTVIDPVCGCDGQTYVNACNATYYGGVTSYTQGECATTCNFDGTLASIPWASNFGFEDYTLGHYIYNGADVFFYEPCSIYPDVQSALYDCQGMAICYYGGIAGSNGEDCPDFLYQSTFVTELISCQYPSCDAVDFNDPLGTMPWLQPSIDQYISQGDDCGCLATVDWITYGGDTLLFFDGSADCNAVDFPDVVFDCSGFNVCAIGEVPDIYFCNEPINFLQNIWTCGADSSGMITASVQLNALLEGAYNGNGTMDTELNDLGLLPLSHPYANAPYNYVDNTVLTSLPPTVVDWVLVEARQDITVPEGLVKAGLLLSNNAIVDPVTMNAIEMPLIAGTSYHFIVRHRNHLDVASPALPAQPSIYHSFVFSVGQAMGTDQVKEMSDGYYTLYAADYTQDGVISVNDYDGWKISPAVLNTYDIADYNMDGTIQATDRDQWFLNRAKIGLIQD